MNRSLFLCSVVVAALSAVGCSDGPFGHTTDEPFTTDWTAPDGLTELQVRVPYGSITVSTGPAGKLAFGGRAKLGANSAAGLKSVAEHGFEFALEPVDEAAGRWQLVVADLPEELDPEQHMLVVEGGLKLPVDVAVKVTTGRGHLVVVERRGDVELRTVQGDIRLERVEGNLVARTDNGNCMVLEHRGGVDLECGYGTVLVRVHRIGDAGVRVHTLAPAITCHLPTDQGFEFEATVRKCYKKKDLRNSFGFEVEPRGESGYHSVGRYLEGGPRVELEVGRGHVSVPAIE